MKSPLKINLSSPEDFLSPRRAQTSRYDIKWDDFDVCSIVFMYRSRVFVSREDKIRQIGLAVILQRAG